jgi:hypothetical protein
VGWKNNLFELTIIIFNFYCSGGWNSKEVSDPGQSLAPFGDEFV